MCFITNQSIQVCLLPLNTLEILLLIFIITILHHFDQKSEHNLHIQVNQIYLRKMKHDVAYYDLKKASHFIFR